MIREDRGEQLARLWLYLNRTLARGFTQGSRLVHKRTYHRTLGAQCGEEGGYARRMLWQFDLLKLERAPITHVAPQTRLYGGTGAGGLW